MGLRDDLDRFHAIGEDERMDLTEFIKHGQLGRNIQVPIKIVSLPEFVYDMSEQGGIGQAGPGEDPEQGDPVDVDGEDGDGDGDGDQAGDGEGEHGHYEMDPEEFAEELDDELDLDLDPKGKKVVEETLGDMVEVAQTGPRSALDVDHLFAQGLKRKLATWTDEVWVREACCIDGLDARGVFEYTRERNVPVSMADVESYMAQSGRVTYGSIDDFESSFRDPKRRPVRHEIDNVPIRDEDERYRHPEVIEQKQKNVVVVNIRDVSGSMRQEKRELVERTFTPLDWYLQGKYDHASFRYVAHDVEAWEVERDEFFGMKSGGGTRISSAYKLAGDILDQHYPFSEWNRYVFGAGDGENWQQDTTEELIPAMNDIECNMHAYIQTKSGFNDITSELNDGVDNIVTANVDDADDVLDAIERILSEAGSESEDN